MCCVSYQADKMVLYQVMGSTMMKKEEFQHQNLQTPTTTVEILPMGQGQQGAHLPALILSCHSLTT